MSVYRPKKPDGSFRSKVYLYDFQLTPAGGRQSRRFHGSTGQTKLAAARKVEARVRQLAAAGKLHQDLTLTDACWRYWHEVYSRQASAVNQAKNQEHLCRLIGGETLLQAIDEDMIAEAVRRRSAEFVMVRKRTRGGLQWVSTGKLVSTSTANRQIVEPMKRLLRRARRVWKLPVEADLDWRAVRRPEPAERVRALSAEEEARLWAEVREDYRPLVWFYLTSGLRKSEALIKRDQLDLERRIAVCRTKSHRPGGAPALVHLSDEQVAVLARELALSNGAYVFTYVARHGPHKGHRRPITYSGLTAHLRRAIRRAELDSFRIHDFRHTFATQLLRATGNLRLVQRALRHADIASTARYAHVADDDVRDGIAALAQSRSYPEVVGGGNAVIKKKKTNSIT